MLSFLYFKLRGRNLRVLSKWATARFAFIALYALCEGHARADIFFTDRSPSGSILKANLDGTGVQIILTGATSAPQGGPIFSGIGLDVAHGFLYAGDATTLFRTNLDGSNRTTLVNVPNLHPQRGIIDVELDLVHRKVYWTNGGLDVSRANLDGTHPETVLKFPLGGDILVQGLAVDPLRGKLFYDDIELVNNRGIYAANLDGTNPVRIVDFGPGSATTNPNHIPQDVEVDVASGKLYWNDSVTNTINRINEDGSGAIETVFQANHLDNALNFDSTSRKIYFVDASSNGLSESIKRINPDGTGLETVLTGRYSIDHVEVFTPSQVSGVPEPASLTLLALGSLSLLGYVRRWRKAVT
jgi:hypothetical protein